METNGNDPITATVLKVDGGEIILTGLTKREHFALSVLQSWISAMDLENPIPMQDVLDLPKNGANWAVTYADALINELNKSKS